jgi:hypothetical protein
MHQFHAQEEPIQGGRRPVILASQSRLPLACAGIAAIGLMIAISARIYQGGYLSYVSGTWATLADDVAHGELYRPLLSPLGYGGTRYFPLYFVLHGALVAIGVPMRFAGHAISVMSAVLLVCSGAIGLYRLGASRQLACAGGILALASRTAVMGAAGMRGDLLPVALGIAGLAFLPRTDREGALPSVLLFGLAALAKPSVVWPACGAMIALAASGQVRRSVLIPASAAIVTILGVLGAMVWSHGEMLASFRAVASGGGFSLQELRENLSYVRPGDLGWVAAGLGLWAVRGRAALKDPYFAALLVCLPVTIVLFSGRGIHVNHFVDMTTIGALATFSSMSYVGAQMTRVSSIAVIVATLLGLVDFTFLDGMTIKHGELDRAAAAISRGSGPILSEDPWIPILAGERPFVLDAYSLEQTRRESSVLQNDLLDRLDHCRFRAVVLLGLLKGSEDWYTHTAFGTGFAEHLSASYSFAGIVGAHAVYLPRCASSAVATLSLPSGSAVETETVMDRGGKPNRIRVLVNWLRSRYTRAPR